MTDKLKIGIACYPTFGGSGVVAAELGLALSDLGHEIHFISSRLPARLQGQSTADVSFHEVNTYSYALFQHAPYSLSLASKMAAVADTFDLDLLHVHYAIPHAISAHLAKEMLDGNIKVVTTLHGTDITLVGTDPSLHRITQFAINKADALTTVSEWLKNETIKHFEPTLPISVVPNFIDPRYFKPDLECKWSGRQHLCGEHPHIIHVSNFRPVKRAPDAVDVLAKVLKHVDAHLLMVGDGPDLQRAVQKARDLDVMHRVSFLGNREDVAYLLASSDIMLLPSESESFGLSALEAMACGCAVVTTTIGGLPELVRDGLDGNLCLPGDIDHMCRCIVSLLEDRDKLAEIKKNAYQRSLDTFDASIVVPKYLEVYQSVLNRTQEVSSHA